MGSEPLILLPDGINWLDLCNRQYFDVSLAAHWAHGHLLFCEADGLTPWNRGGIYNGLCCFDWDLD